MPSLLDPNLKLQRATEHLDALDLQIAAFFESKPYNISSEDDLERGEHVVTIQTKFPPLSMGSVAGDFICNLRSSLDHLAWQLAALSGSRPSPRVCFPIWGTNSDEAQKRITESTVGIPAGAIALMRAFQPYNSGKSYKTTQLWILNRLWNVDKHRHITLHTCSLEIKFPRMPRTLRPPTTEIVNGSGVVRFPLAAKPYMDCHPRLILDIQFGDESAGISVNRQGLRGMYQFIGEKVIPTFAGFFTESPILRE